MAARLPALLCVSSLIAATACSAVDADAPTGGDAFDQTESSPRATRPHALLIHEPDAVTALAARGFGLGHHVGAEDGARADALAAKGAYKDVAAALADALDEKVAENDRSLSADQKDHRLRVGMQYWRRLFDARWLRSPLSRFTLVAVTNRMDRAEDGDCGEVRFVYRLEYDDPGERRNAAAGAEYWARMPMTLMAVVPQPKGTEGCSAVAKKWLALDSLSGDARLDALAELLPRGAARTFETNLQAVRWPSAAWPAMGGNAEYMLNIFRNDNGAAAKRIPLENTPDVARLKGDAAEKDALAQWIADHAREVEAGTAKIPDRFLAQTAFSIGPRGFARLGNRPFAQLFGDGAELSAPSGDGALIRSRAGLVRRLDEQSCQGCHQSRSIAGFHMLGDEERSDRLDQLVVGASAHLRDELTWRQQQVEAVASGGAFATPRPFAERAAEGAGGVGAHCGLGRDATFARWTCEEGLSCEDANGESDVGVCIRTTKLEAGDLCEKNDVAPSDDPKVGDVKKAGELSCATTNASGTGTCTRSTGGFPNGACTSMCAKAGQLTENGSVVCGTVPPTSFNECLLQKKSFEECMRPITLMLRASCDVDRPCRDDYACTYVPGAPAGVGQCMPPYFLFQARVDGHD